MVDAYQNALDRIDFIMVDTTYYNSKLQIYKPIDNRTLTITEGYFDASHSFSAFLMEDSDYWLRTINPDGTNTSFGRITIVKPDTKELGQVYIRLNPQAVLIGDNIFMNAYMDDLRYTLYVEYDDDLGETINVTITIYFENGTVYYQDIYNSTNTLNLEYNTTDYNSTSFTVLFTVFHTSLGNSPVTYSMSLLVPVVWAIGISAFWYPIFSLGLCTAIGGIATRRSLIVGSVLFTTALLLCYGIGWLDLGGVEVILIVFSAVLLLLSIINYVKQGGES